MSVKQRNRHADAIWHGRRGAMRMARKRYRDTCVAVHPVVPLAQLASDHYSQVGSGGSLHWLPIFWRVASLYHLWRAKHLIGRVLGEAADTTSGLSAEQCDICSTIALRGVGPLRPDIATARQLCQEGLKLCEQGDATCESHTRSLLACTMAESYLLEGKENSAFVYLQRAHWWCPMPSRTGEPAQVARILRRVAAGYAVCGAPERARPLFEQAQLIAEEHSHDQLRKIKRERARYNL